MNKYKVLIIGSGGREHALGWKLAQSPKVKKIYFAPGNTGTAEVGENIPINALDIKSLVSFAGKEKIDLTVVGPDDALAAGIVDVFLKNNLKIFGPTKKAAKIESSKAFAKKIMIEQNIPTASSKIFSDFDKAKIYVQNQKFPLVIKASGLALGKGVVIVKNKENAIDTLKDIMKKKVFGDAGTKVVIEEFLQGQEISVHVLSDGKNYSLFPIALDHKTIFDNNRGPNTGGMGTIAPLKIDKKIFNEIEKTVVIPLLKYLEKKGKPFSGCLFPGIMLTKNGPKVLEFNARFGDPETQSYMRILKSDLFEILFACATKNLSDIKIKWSKSSACCIIVSSPGYPGNYKKGEEILGLEKIKKQKNIVPFHAGTKLEKLKIITNGGRVLGISSVGKTLPEAIQTAYEALGENNIYFKNMHYRKDIGMHWLNLKNKLKS